MRDANGPRRREALTNLATRQHGVVSLRQLEGLGYSRGAVSRRCRDGSLRRMFPRVYRVGGSPITPELRAVAALLWAGDAVASHETAAGLWGMSRPAQELHVTAPRRLTSPPRGIHVHAARLTPRDRGTLRGVAVTSPARTLLDLAAHHDPDQLSSLVERSVLDGLVTPGRLHDVVQRHPGRRGCRRLREVVEATGSSALERRVEAILRDARFPPHERELEVGRFRLDFAWPAARVAIEADGRRWHSSAEDFARDRAKHNLLVAEGWRILRVTWDDLDRPAAVEEAARRLLRG